ncbi:MAG: hypothetical protein H6718_16030 [Polyangiaceae bacterium]|nr:hypothetical protein [Polyangiaceae bacterium]
MATLEYKRRVRLPEDFFLDKRSLARRPWPRWPWVVAGWLGFTGLCFAITTDRVPLGKWLTEALEPAAAAAPPSRPKEAPAITTPPVVNPAETQAAPATPVAELAEDAAEADPLADETPAADLPEPSGASPLLAAAEAPPDQDSLAPSAAPPDADEEQPSTGDADDVAERAAEALPSPPEPAQEKPAVASQSSVGTSCEAAIASYQEEIRIGGAAAPPDLSRAQFASVLENGRYFSHCGVPDAMRVDICAAVRNGRAVGVTIRTSPGNSTIQACIARAVRGLGFPAHPRLDVTRTSFAAQ